MTHICISSRLTIIGSHNGLPPGRCQAIISTNAGILLIGPLGTKFSEILISIFSFRKMHLKMLYGKLRYRKWQLILSLPRCVRTKIAHTGLLKSFLMKPRNYISHLIIMSDNTPVTPGDKASASMVHIDGLVQERLNSSALAMELHLSYSNPSIYWQTSYDWKISKWRLNVKIIEGMKLLQKANTGKQSLQLLVMTTKLGLWLSFQWPEAADLPCGQDGVLGMEAMDVSVLHGQSHDAHTLTSLHDQVQGEVLHKVVCVVVEGLEQKMDTSGLWQYRWLNARLQYLQCICTGDTAVLH